MYETCYSHIKITCMAEPLLKIDECVISIVIPNVIFESGIRLFVN